MAAAAILLPSISVAQSGPNPSPDGLWQSLSMMPMSAGRQAWVRPPRFKAFRLAPDLMEASLGQAPSEKIERAKRVDHIITLPRPDGTYERFSVVESPVMEEALAEKFPTIKTFTAQGIDDPSARARLDFTPLGFHAQVFSARGGYYIDPYWRSDREYYASYFVRDYTVAGKDWTCGVLSEAAGAAPSAARAPEQMKQNGDTLRKFRVAVAAQGEYTAFFGGSVTGALAGIVTTINRVNQLYENDLAIRLLLVANNNLIIYTNASTDPYSVNNATSTTLNQNQSNCDTVIGSANYDIGHLVNTGGGGLAGLGVVCTSGQKARGCTGSSDPVGDPFDIDYVAHEMGHQFGADHTFNGTSGSCSGSNRNGPTAYEPGSGSTIMAYAGICGVDNLQPHSDAYFHFASITQILGYVETSGTCSTNVATGNTMPTVSAGSNYTIPKGTPFELTASGSDGDGDTLTFCWEEKDLGAAQALSAADNGASPLFRTYTPTTNTTRMFPQLARILSNTSSNDEKLPTLARTMTFRVTVRDNRAGGGGVNDDDTLVTVVTSAGPFKITAPNAAINLSGQATVTWDVVNTTLSPVNASNVHILLSTDGGQSFGTMLASNSPNDGTQIVNLPSISTTNARIKVSAANNIFFDISDANVTLVPSGPNFVATGSNTIDDASGNNSGGIDPGETGVKLYVKIQNSGVSGATGVSATLTSLTATASITTPTSSYPNLAVSASASNTSAFVLDLSAAHACANPINLRLRIASNEGTNTTDFSINPGAIQTPVTNSFAVAANIPDNNSSGTNIAFTIAGLGTINDLDFRLDGSSCNTIQTSPLVGLNHSYVGDLVITLTSPTGTTVTLINRPGSGGGSGSSGNNFCNTRLDDDGAVTSIQAIAQSGSDAPCTGTWLPANALSAFDGQSPNGTWILNVSDRASADTGTVHSFSLIITAGGCSSVSNTPPVVEAGTNVTIILPTSNVVLNATVSDDGQPSGITNLSWSKQSGPGTVSFVPSASTEDPTATFSSTGIYTLALAVNDGALTNSDTVQVTVLAASNQVPSVDAGKDEVITLPVSNIVLNATVTDDGLPAGVTNFLWAKQSGPGTVTFTPSATVEDPTATFPTSGVYILTLTANDGGLTNADTVQITVQSSVARVTFFTEPMSTNPGWTADSAWDFGVPEGAGGSSGSADPASGFTGTNVYGYNLAGDYTINLPEKNLTTPSINCSGYTNVILTFRRWLGVERSLYDHAYIRASTNGTTWVEVWANPDASIDDGAWTNVQYDLSAIADRQTNVYLRWVMGETDNSVRYCGWNIDDVELSGYVAGPADTDGDSIPDFWETGHGLNPAVSNAATSDTDGDRVTDVNEYIADTLPTDGASYLKLNVISNTGPRSILFGPSSTGRIYTLQFVDELVLGAWSNVPNQVDQPGDGTSQDMLSDTNGTPNQRLYRIGVELP